MIFPLLPRNSEVARAYDLLRNRSVDQGCHRVSYSSRVELPTLGVMDGVVNACEVWTAYAKEASQIPSASWIFQESVPWFYDSQVLNPARRQILQNLDTKIVELQRRFASAPDAPLQIARGLYNWIISELGVSPVNRVEEQGLLASLENRQANCSEFFSIFKFAFARAGLELNPVFVFESVNGDRSEHVAALFQFGGQNYVMDPLYGSFNVQHRRWLPLSLREFWAWHFNSRAELSSNRNEVRVFFQRAESLDPSNPHFPNNFGLQLEDWGLYPEAKNAYLRALRADSHFVEAYVNLSAFCVSRGNYREALIWAQGGLREQGRDSRLHYNMALAYFNLGRFAQASRAIDAALANSSEPHPHYISLQSDIRARRPH